jgi:hypothetical protein
MQIAAAGFLSAVAVQTFRACQVNTGKNPGGVSIDLYGTHTFVPPEEVVSPSTGGTCSQKVIETGSTFNIRNA